MGRSEPIAAHLATIVPVASPYLSVDFPIRSNLARPVLDEMADPCLGMHSPGQAVLEH